MTASPKKSHACRFLLSHEFIEFIKSPRGVNQQSEMARLYRMGVDGIISDNPERLRIVLAGCGATLRPKRTFSSPYLLP